MDGRRQRGASLLGSARLRAAIALPSIALLTALGLAPTAGAATISVSAIAPLYTPPSSFGQGQSILTGDFNGDGRADVAFANSGGWSTDTGCPQLELEEGCVSVLIGNGDGSFKSLALAPGGESFPNSPVDYPTDGSPYAGTAALAAGDLNGDGNTDLVVANRAGNDGECDIGGCVAILYGNGDGTFRKAVTLNPDIGGYPEAVAVGDFTGDGRQSIAVAMSTGQLYTFVNEGDGTDGLAEFNTEEVHEPLAGEPGLIDGMAVADLTGHGPEDLVLSTGPAPFSQPATKEPCATGDCVQALINRRDGSGGFEPAVGYPVAGTGEIAAADLRGKGRDDVLVPNGPAGEGEGSEGGGFDVLLNEGDGTLAAPVSYSYPGALQPRGLVVADLAGAGHLDVAVADHEAALTALFAGAGDGTFAYAGEVADEEGLQAADNALAAADLNGDCRPDLVLGSEAFEEVAEAHPIGAARALGQAGGALAMLNTAGGGVSACPQPSPPPLPPAQTTPAPQPRIAVQAQGQERRAVRASIAATGLPVSCTRSGLRVHLRVSLAPSSLARRRVGGRYVVKTHTVVEVDGRRVAASDRRSFSFRLSRSQFGVGANTMKVIVSVSGSGILSGRRSRTLRFSRCLAQPVFTG